MTENTINPEENENRAKTIPETSEIDTTTTEEENAETETIVVKKNPVLSILIKFTIGFVVFFFTMLIIGFVMGLAGVRPPSLEWDVVNNQWNKVTGQETKDPISELDKKPVTETKPSEEAKTE